MRRFFGGLAIVLAVICGCGGCIYVFVEGLRVPITTASPPALVSDEAVIFRRQLEENGYKNFQVTTVRDGNHAIIKFTTIVNARDCDVEMTKFPGQPYGVTAINGKPRSLPIAQPKFYELESNLTIQCQPAG